VAGKVLEELGEAVERRVLEAEEVKVEEGDRLVESEITAEVLKVSVVDTVGVSVGLLVTVTVEDWV